MRELLPDNIALSERLTALPPGLAPPKALGEREIGGEKALVTWVSSFATYVAIIAETHPGRVRDMLAYMRLIIREANKFGGTGWLTYDSVFRRNHEGSSGPWNYLDASLYRVYIHVVSQGSKAAVPCRHCHESDHLLPECAIALMLSKPWVSPPEPPSSLAPDRAIVQRGKQPAPYPRQLPICASWNNSSCKYPGKCSDVHVCMSCYGNHPASACRERTATAWPQKQHMGTPNRV